MSYYQLGLIPIASQKQFSCYAVGASAMTASPGTIADEARAIQADVLATTLEISNYINQGLGGNASEEQQAWITASYTPWVKRWSKWFDSHGTHGTLGNWIYNLGAASLWDQAQVFRGELIELRKAAKRLGFTFLSPDPHPPEPGLFESIGNTISNLIKSLLWIALGVGVGVLLLHHFGHIG